MTAPPPLSAERVNEANRILRDHIYKRYENQAFPQEWRNLPEVPSTAEICPPSRSLVDKGDVDEEDRDKWNQYQNDPLYDRTLPHNIVDGPWPSREAYLGAHYQILREDAIAPLRRAVESFKNCPSMVDDADICVYRDVSVSNMTNCCDLGFLTAVGDNQGTHVEQDWCWFPSGILPPKANQMETIKTPATRNHGSPEQ